MADETPVTSAVPAAPPDEGYLHSLATSLGIDPEAVKSTAKAIWANPVTAAKEIAGAQADEFVDAAKHPIKTARLALNGVISSITNPEAQAAAKARFNEPGFMNKLQGAEEYVTSGIPTLGGGLVKSEEQAGKGNIAGAAGTLTGVVAPLLTGAAEELPAKAADTIHEAGAKARENMAARKEASINEARSGKVITLEPQKALGEPAKQLPAAPEPDKFANISGKLVGPTPSEAVEKPVPPVEQASESTDPVESLIMSDKIGGKKVRGEIPKPPSNIVQGREVVAHLMKTGKMSKNDAMGRTRTYGAGEYALVDVPIQPEPLTQKELDNFWPKEGHVYAGDEYNPDQAKKYASRKTPLPAIVLGPDAEVVDGNHRIAAAELRGQKTIQAYVPVGYDATDAIIHAASDSPYDKFAAVGGKLVTPAPKAEGLEKPSPAAEKTPESADAIEPLIMSDKIGGKKVRGALPKLAPPPADSKLLYHYTTNSFENFDPMRGGTEGDFGTHFGTIEQANDRMAGAGDSPELVGKESGGHIRPVYVDIKNPIRLEDHGDFRPDNILDQLQNKNIITHSEFKKIWNWKTLAADPKRLRDILEKKGYDGIIYLNRMENVPHGESFTEDLMEASDEDFLKAHPHVKGNDSYIALRPEQITSKYAQPPPPEAFTSFGGKFVGQQPTASPVKTAFSGTHYSPVPVESDTISGDTRGKAAAGSEKERLQHPNRVPGVYAYREGATPEPQIGSRANKYDVSGDKTIADISGAQKTMFQQAHADAVAKYKAAGDNDTIASQKALNDAEAHLRDAGFDGYEHKESGTGSVFLFGDQPIGAPDMLTQELQSPLKEKYNVKITENDGTTHMEPIEAFSAKNAIAVAQKKFPGTRAYSWEIEHFDERTPSTEYSVPTRKLAKMPESAGRSELHTMNHELGHAMVGQNEGLQQTGVLSSSHPELRGYGARAAVRWPGRTIYDLASRTIRPDKVAAVVKTMMGGIAADEAFNDVPRSANHNFRLDAGGDGTAAYKILLSAGVSHGDAMTYMHKAIDDAKTYLTQPAVAGIIQENAGVRESGLSRQYHVSPERLTSMHQEAQRRIANAKNQPASDTGVHDDRANGGSNAEVSSADVASRKSGSAQGTGEGVSDQSIVSENKIEKPKGMLSELAAALSNPDSNYQIAKTRPERVAEIRSRMAANLRAGKNQYAGLTIAEGNIVGFDNQNAMEKIRGAISQGGGKFAGGPLADGRWNIQDPKTGQYITVGADVTPAKIKTALSTVTSGQQMQKPDGSWVTIPDNLLSEEKIQKPSKEVTPALAQQIADTHAANGGSTFNLTHGDLAGTDNYAVSAHPDRGYILDHPPTAQDIQNFATKNKDLLKNPEKSIGTWHDTSNDTHALDVVATLPDREKAIALGVANNQKAIYHLGGEGEIPTGGTGEIPVSDHTVSTRVPSRTVKGETIEDHTDQSRLSDMEAAKAAPEYVAKMTQRTNATPGFTPPADADVQAQADAYIRHAADNIKFVHEKVSPEEFARDSQWYPVGAYERGIAVAKQHGITPHQAYAVTAVESPMTDWDQNTSLAERTVNIWKNRQNTKFTPEMQASADKITSLPANKAFRAPYKKLVGKTLGELPTTELQAHWLRLYDEAHNPREYETWGPDGQSHGLATTQDGSPKKVGWSFQSHIQKAIEILKDGSDENISKQLGYGHKVRNFYNNQVAPNDPRYLTMDTHAINVAQLRPMSGKTEAVRFNFGGISNSPHGLNGTYPMHDAAYRVAAKELDIPIPSRLQSPTWVKIRDVFTDDFKTPDNQAAVDTIWKEHSDGKITADQARNRIWDYAVEWNRKNAAGSGPSSDQGKLFESGVRGEPSARTTGRGVGSGTAQEVPASSVDAGDAEFNFGANVKSQAAEDTAKVAEMMKAKTAAMKKGIGGLNKPSKK